MNVKAKDDAGKSAVSSTSTSINVRQTFLETQFKTYAELDASRQLMGLHISQSDKKRARIRYRDKSAPKRNHLVTFSLSAKTGCYSRAKGTRGV